MVLFLNLGEGDSHSSVQSSINHSAQSCEVRTSVSNPYYDPCPRRQWLQCVHVASKQAYVARSFPYLNFGLYVGQFDADHERITARTWALGVHSKSPSRKHCLFSRYGNSAHCITRCEPRRPQI